MALILQEVAISALSSVNAQLKAAPPSRFLYMIDYPSRARGSYRRPTVMASDSVSRVWRVARRSLYDDVAARDREWEMTMTETWETPSFDEIRMDAEIGSYADEFAEDRD
jgi:hypothetical protein